MLMSFQFSRAFSGVIKVNGQRAQHEVVIERPL